MDVCVAGNGGQLLKAFDEESKRKLCAMALACLPQEHPVKRLALVQSKDPKQEVALGLLSDADAMRGAIQGESAWAVEGQPPARDDAGQHMELIGAFLPSFYGSFPLAGERLLSGLFDISHGSRVQLTPAAQMELRAIVDNELLEPSDDDFAAYVRCFVAMKRLWRI